jgi:hypothetical protein
MPAGGQMPAHTQMPADAVAAADIKPEWQGEVRDSELPCGLDADHRLVRVSAQCSHHHHSGCILRHSTWRS